MGRKPCRKYKSRRGKPLKVRYGSNGGSYVRKNNKKYYCSSSKFAPASKYWANMTQAEKRRFDNVFARFANAGSKVWNQYK